MAAIPYVCLRTFVEMERRGVMKNYCYEMFYYFIVVAFYFILFGTG
jgi:hypothetical protein